MLNKVLLATAAFQVGALAQNCPSLKTTYGDISVASGYEAKLVAQGLSQPRGLIFDNNNNLLVIERQVGVTAFKVEGAGSCVTLKDKKTIVTDGTLNHGIELSDDSKTLYASSKESVLKYAYDSGKLSINGAGQVIVKGMTTTGQVTRTLLLSRKTKNKLLVSRGSDDNIDLSTVDINSGESQIRIFDPSKNDVQYSTGTTLGWGLRNAVGVAENPSDGGIWSTENNADNLERDGFEIHENNPAEELNYHGKLVDDTKNTLLGQNYGYPLCYGAWDIDEIPSAGQLQVGDQFAIAEENATRQDAFCRDSRQKPRLVFQPHTSPIDVKFDSKGENLYVSLRGSWNRDDPVGYSVSVIKFTNNAPTDSATSTSALSPIFSNTNTTACPGKCFRPAGLAWDRNGRLYVSSDATGEIYVITKSGGDPLDGAKPKASGTAKGGSGGAGVLAAVVAVVVAYLL